MHWKNRTSKVQQQLFFSVHLNPLNIEIGLFNFFFRKSQRHWKQLCSVIGHMKFWSTFSNVMEIVHFPSTFKRWCCFFQVVDFFLFNFATSFFILRWLWYVMPSVRSLRARDLLSLGGKVQRKGKKVDLVW